MYLGPTIPDIEMRATRSGMYEKAGMHGSIDFPKSN
jgi:hypothetical protein